MLRAQDPSKASFVMEMVPPVATYPSREQDSKSSMKLVPNSMSSVSTVVQRLSTPPQASIAVGIPSGRSAPQATVESVGISSKLGPAVSTMVIVCWAIEELPQASVAINVRVTVQFWGQSPAKLSTDTVTETGVLQSSSALGSSWGRSVPHSMVTSAGTSRKTGAESSET